MVNFNNDWDGILQDEFEKPYYKALREFLKKEYKTQTIFPDMYDIFNALKATPYGNVKAVIIGQDPYHGPGQAHGMCFSVRKGIPKPPSLVNIFKELENDLGIKEPDDGFLEPWAKQGVLLLNSVLTVRKGMASHTENQRQKLPGCLFTVGSVCARKSENSHKQKTSFTHSGTPQPSFGI